MINLIIIFNKTTDQGSDSFYCIKQQKQMKRYHSIFPNLQNQQNQIIQISGKKILNTTSLKFLRQLATPIERNIQMPSFFFLIGIHPMQG